MSHPTAEIVKRQLGDGHLLDIRNAGRWDDGFAYVVCYANYPGEAKNTAKERAKHVISLYPYLTIVKETPTRLWIDFAE